MDEEKNKGNDNLMDSPEKASKETAKKITDTGKTFWKYMPKSVKKWIYIGIAGLVALLITMGVINMEFTVVTEAFKSILSGIIGGNSGVDTGDEYGNYTGRLVTIGDNGEYLMHDKGIPEEIKRKMEEGKIDLEASGYEDKSGEEILDMIPKYIYSGTKTVLPKTGIKGDIDGIISVNRLDIADNSEPVKLSYKKYKDFIASPSYDTFSINPENFKLVIFAREGNNNILNTLEEVSKIDKEGTFGFKMIEFDYQVRLQQYTAPLNFLVALHVMSQDTKFMNDFLKLVEGKEDESLLEITYVESIQVTRRDYNYSGERYRKITTENASNVGPGEPPRPVTVPISEIQMSKSVNKLNYQNYLMKTKEEFLNKEERDVINNENIDVYISDHPMCDISYSISGEWVVTKANTWIKNVEKNISSNYVVDEGEWSDFEEIYSFNPEPLTKYIDTKEGTKRVTIERKININRQFKITTKSFTYVVVESENSLKLDEESGGIIPLIKKYKNVKSNFISGADNLFGLLEQNEDTQKHAKIMRYVLSYLSGVDYGVSLEEIEGLMQDSFGKFNGSFGLSEYLAQYSNDNYEKYMTADKKFYKMYGDGVGWPTIGAADMQWKSQHNLFNVPGKVLENGEEKDVESVEAYVNGKLGSYDAEYTNSEIAALNIYVEAGLVNKIGDEVNNKFLNSVKNDTSGLDLSRQQLYALSSVAANFGSLKTWNGKTFKDVYLEGLAQEGEDGNGIEINDWQQNRYIWENWLYGQVNISRKGSDITPAPGHLRSRDHAYLTYVKGIFKFTNETECGKVYSGNKFKFYTQNEVNSLGYANDFTGMSKRTGLDDEEVFTYEEAAGAITGTVLIDGYEYQLYTSTNGKTYIWYLQDIGTWADDPSFKSKGCCMTSEAIIASGYGSEVRPSWGIKVSLVDEHHLVAGSCNIKNPPGATMKEADFERIRQHLKSGGEVLIHVVNGSGFTNWQHWMPLVDISEDGQYVFDMNTESSYGEDKKGWIPLSKLANGVNCYYLVNGIIEE